MSTSEPPGAARVTDGSACRLVVYGSLAPGRRNHHQLRDLAGSWIKATVRGHLRQEGWGAELGYPGLALDPAGPTIDVQAPRLARSTGSLGEFEGSGYRRTVTTVSTAEGDLMASIYVLAID